MDIEHELNSDNLEDLDKEIDEKIKEPISGFVFNGKIVIKKANSKYIVTLGYDPI